MKIYAIRDRLIDYFMQPFVGPDDKNVLASVARLVNNGEVTSDIAQAPHQFEVWALGNITEDGHLVAERNYLADCSSLVRGSIRPTTAGGVGGGRETEGAAEGSTSPTLGARDAAGTANGVVPAQAPATHRGGAEAYKAATRGT